MKLFDLRLNSRHIFDTRHLQNIEAQDEKNPVPGTKVSLPKIKGLFYLFAAEFVRHSGQIKKTRPAKQDEAFGQDPLTGSSEHPKGARIIHPLEQVFTKMIGRLLNLVFCELYYT